MDCVGVFYSLEDAEQCAFRYFVNNCCRQHIGDANYIYRSNEVLHQMWIYRDKAFWFVIYCSPGSWSID